MKRFPVSDSVSETELESGFTSEIMLQNQRFLVSKRGGYIHISNQKPMIRYEYKICSRNQNPAIPTGLIWFPVSLSSMETLSETVKINVKFC